MIVLKHLANEFNIDPYNLRQILRKQFGKPSSRRWRWQEDDPNLKATRDFLSHYLKSQSSTPTPSSTPHTATGTMTHASTSKRLSTRTSSK